MDDLYFQAGSITVSNKADLQKRLANLIIDTIRDINLHEEEVTREREQLQYRQHQRALSQNILVQRNVVQQHQ